jgi:creatinine amidohydrolase/Fe(II)-dependent formamide hydrolase-like protein
MEMNEMVYELSNMTWSEAKEKFDEAKLAIVPIGATEQHGMHLGVGARAQARIIKILLS